MQNNFIFKDGTVVMLAHVILVQSVHSQYHDQNKFLVMFSGEWTKEFPLEEKESFLTVLFKYKAQK